MIYCLFAILLFRNQSSLQEVTFDTLTFETVEGSQENISFGNVCAITQDRHGFMWFGHLEGLIRFDGYEYRQFKYDPHDPTTLNSHLVDALEVARDGEIWVGHRGSGISVFNPESETFRRLTHDPEDPASLSDNFVYCIREIDTGFLIGTEKGVAFFDRETQTFSKALPPVAGSKRKAAFAILEDRNRHLWIGRRSGLERWRPNSQEPPELLLNEKVISNIHQVNDGTLWVTTTEGEVYLVDPATFAVNQVDISRYRTPGNQFTARKCIVQLNSTELWIGSRQGIFIFDIESARLKRVVGSDPSIGAGLGDNSINTLFKSRSGLIWIAPTFRGLNLFLPNNDAFRTVKFSERNKTISGPWVESVTCLNNGQIWVVTQVEGAPTPIDVLHLDRGVIDRIPIWFANRIAQGPDDRHVWIATKRKELFRYRLETKSSEKFALSKSPRVMKFSPSGTLFLGDAIGVLRIDLQDNTVIPLRVKADTLNPINVWCLEFDRDGTLWVGADNGLFALPPNQTVLQPIAAETPEGVLPMHGQVFGLLVDSKNTLWVISTGGLHRRVHQRGLTVEFDSMTDRLGIPGSHYGQNLLEDGRGRLWTSVNVTDIELEKRWNFEKHYRADIFYGAFRGSYSKSSSGLLFYGGADGLLIVDPDRFQPHQYDPTVVITEFKANHRRRPWQGTELILSPSETHFSFKFSALDYSAPRQIKYQFRLEGYDETWIAVDSLNRVATYSNLEPGRYTLRINGSNRLGVMSSNPLEISVVVKPSVWETKWAKFLFFILFLGAVWVFSRLGNRILKAKADRLKALVGQRTQELDEQLQRNKAMLSNVSHELFTPLTLISASLDRNIAELGTTGGSSGVSYHLTQNLKIAKRSTSRMTGLIQQLLRFTKKVEVEAEKEAQEVGPIIQTVCQSFRQLAALKTIDLSCKTVADAWILCERDTIETVLSNLLSNAIKYSDDRKPVVVSMEAKENELELVVRDEGPGISDASLDQIFERFGRVQPGETPGLGLGLFLVRELVHRNGGRVEIASKVQVGTRFSVFLPRIVPSKKALKEAAHNSQIGGVVQHQMRLDATVIESVPTQEPKGSNSPRSGPVLLIVEDNHEIRNLLFDLFDHHFICLLAADGKEGLKLARKHLPDIILSDILMPNIDGFEMCRKIKEDGATNHIPIVLLTALCDIESRKKGWRMYADDYVVKPFESDELILRLKNQLALRTLLKQKYQREFFFEAREAADTQDVGDALLTQQDRDQRFVGKLKRVLKEHYQNPEFDVRALADQLCMSRRQLQRKTNSVLGKTPSSILYDFRFGHAVSLLGCGHPVHVATLSVGWRSPTHFSNAFRARFQMSPSRWQQNLLDNKEAGQGNGSVGVSYSADIGQPPAQRQ